MSIETQVNRIKNNIAAFYEIVEERGASLPDSQNSDNLSITLETILKGSGIEVLSPEDGDIIYCVGAVSLLDFTSTVNVNTTIQVLGA